MALVLPKTPALVSPLTAFEAPVAARSVSPWLRPVTADLNNGSSGPWSCKRHVGLLARQYLGAGEAAAIGNGIEMICAKHLLRPAAPFWRTAQQNAPNFARGFPMPTNGEVGRLRTFPLQQKTNNFSK